MLCGRWEHYSNNLITQHMTNKCLSNMSKHMPNVQLPKKFEVLEKNNYNIYPWVSSEQRLRLHNAIKKKYQNDWNHDF